MRPCSHVKTIIILVERFRCASPRVKSWRRRLIKDAQHMTMEY
jgi:hypothetical protein